MDGISYTYKVERIDTRWNHGWIVWECSEGYMNEIFFSSSFDEIKAFIHDLGA